MTAVLEGPGRTGEDAVAAAGASCLYRGWVRHRRYVPRPHEFRYRLFMVYLDLDELDDVFRGRWLWSTRRPAWARFKRSDYLGPADVPLKQAVLDEIERGTGRRPRGPVRMLTNLRYLGYAFNPVTFYYCLAVDGAIDSLCAEITNTPWAERHRYTLGPVDDVGNGEASRFRFAKEFHVSPFFEMELDYDWRFTAPGDDLMVQMESRRQGELVFDVTLNLERRAITGGELARTLLLHPWMSGKVSLGIYWNALRLWRKGAPFHTHPDKRSGSDRGGRK